MEQLIKKLTKVGQSLPTFAADKTNTQQRYDYISADAVLSIVGKALAENGVMILPAVSDELIEVVNPKPNQTRYDSLVTLKMTVTDGIDSIELMWLGRGSDYMTPDKATYKAITSGHKYFEMKLFNIGIGNEDGEHENQPAQNKAPDSNGQLEAVASNYDNVDMTLTKKPTVKMLQDLHVLGNEVEGDNWKSVVADYHAKFETQLDADGKLSTKSWTWPQYWEVFKALEKKAEGAS